MKHRIQKNKKPTKKSLLGTKKTAFTPTDFQSQKLHIARSLHQKGLFNEAVNICRDILLASPDDCNALQILATIAIQTNHFEDAVVLYGKLLNFNPSHPSLLNNHAIALMEIGRPIEALHGFDKAISVKHDFPEAYYNRGMVLMRHKHYKESVISFDKAIALKENYADAYSNRGNALRNMKQYQDALLSYNKALAINPKLAEAYNNSGNIFLELKRYKEAFVSYEHAITINPNYADAHANRGSALKNMKQYQDALLSYDKALAINPTFTEAYNNRGNTLVELKRYKEALESYDRAIVLNQNYAEAYYNCGNMLLKIKSYDDAIERYEKAIKVKPDFAEAYHNRGHVLSELAMFEKAEKSYRQALLIKSDYSEVYSNLLFMMNYSFTANPIQILSEARQFEKIFLSADDLSSQNAVQNKFSLHNKHPSRLRVGYVSGDYRQHAVSYFVEQLFAMHDRSRFEIFAYTTNDQHDSVTQQLQCTVDHWVELIELSDAESVQRIQDDLIDVLIDLSGHSAHNRLGIFTRRAAPVQAHYLGFMGSTGITAMDYWIGDRFVTPEENDAHFSETVWRLPRTWVSYSGSKDAPETVWSPSNEGTVLLGSFNNLKKITPATLALWAKVLIALPEAKLLLKTEGLAQSSNRKRILESFASYGIVSDRIELQDHQSTTAWTAHMASYNCLDLALDPVGAVGGGTTTCDALWMGVPVICLEGDRMASRMTASMLHAISQSDWIAKNEEEYIAKVVTLARDVEGRILLRSTQRSRMAQSTLCDTKGLVKALEDAYDAMFNRWVIREGEIAC